MGTQIRGEKLNLRAKWVGIVSSLRAMTRHPGGFLACHNRGLSLARTVGSWLQCRELFIPLDYAPRALRVRAAPKRAAETNEPAERMERARREEVFSPLVVIARRLRARGSRSIDDRWRPAAASTVVRTYTLGRYRRCQER